MAVLMRIISAGCTPAGWLTLKPAGSVMGPLAVLMVNSLASTMPVRKTSKISPRPERGVPAVNSVAQSSLVSPGSGTP